MVAKGFLQIYGIDYFENFSPIALLNSVRILISLAFTLNWALYHLDIKNALFYGDKEEVYMEQPLEFVA